VRALGVRPEDEHGHGHTEQRDADGKAVVDPRDDKEEEERGNEEGRHAEQTAHQVADQGCTE